MVADRAYWPGLREHPSGRTNLLYFAAAVPTVGFVHVAADPSPLNAAGLEGYAEDRLINRAPRIGTASRRLSSARSG
jgi:hypothetical protein